MTSIKKILTPDVGGAAEVTVIEVLVKVGDHIEADTAVVSLESDKATMEIPAEIAGIVHEVQVKVGDHVTHGSVLLSVQTTEADDHVHPVEINQPEVEQATPQAPAASAAERSVEMPAAKVEQEIEENVANQQVHAGPSVRRIAREFGIDLTRIKASGPKGRILKEDVQAYVKAQLAKNVQSTTGMQPEWPIVDFAKWGEVSIEPLSRIKKISGKYLQRNAMFIPHVTQMNEADITLLEAFRQGQNESLKAQNVKLTPLVFIMKAVVAALKEFPQFNASLDAQGENLILKKYFHLGVAVDTPQGLVVPVIRDVDKKGLVELAKELAELSEKARNKLLTPQEMQGGCFSISSLGGIGGTAFTPIINYPEVAILGVSRSMLKPIYQEDGSLAPRLMLPLSLSYDHRVIDGADGARFIVHLSEMLADIRRVLLLN